MRVYQYGLLAPKINAQVVDEQMRLAHRYRNTLIEIERARRSALRSVLGKAGDITTLEAAVVEAKKREEEAAAVVSKKRKSTRTRSETADDRQALRLARAHRSDTVRSLREARQRVREDSDIISESDAINDRAAAAIRGARALSGLYWGTYLVVEAAMQASKAMPLYDGHLPNDPRFVRWAGDGQIAVQLQGGLPISKLFSESDNRARLDRWDTDHLHSKAREGRVALHVRAGSNDDGTPVWASFPMILHRDLPMDASVKWIKVARRKIGPRTTWTVDFTIDTPACDPTCGRGMVGIDIGWRVIGEELRVAAWKGTDGAHGEVRLSREMISQLRKAEELRSVRDKEFDGARERLVTWLRSLEQIPGWLRDASATLHQWKSPARLAALAKRWRDNRFDGDHEAFGAIEAWRYHDHHLWEWESSQRRKALRHRREIYRLLGVELAKRYEIVSIEAFDLRVFAERLPPEAAAENEIARSNRVLAATSELRLAVVNAFRSRGGREMKIPAADTTRECHVCGVVEAFDAANGLSHTCANGHTWDQDSNAAENLVWRGATILLDRMRERLRDEKNTEGARKTENDSGSKDLHVSRWVKAREMRAEKDARKGGDREAAINPSE